MRVLIVTQAGRQQLYPLVPLAWACRAAGHDVRIAGPRDATDDIVHTGLPAVTVADTATNPSAEDLVSFAWAWEPDVVVYGSADHAGAVTAGALGVPAVRYVTRPQPPNGSPEYARLLEKFGVDRSFQPARTLDPTPPSMRTGEAQPTRIPGRISMRHVPYHGAGAVPRWLVEPRERPRICITDTPEAVITAIAESDVDIVVLADGPAGVLPQSARLAMCTPLQLVLPHCDLVVQQGNDSTTFTAAALSVPQLVITAERGVATNGERVVASGVGQSLHPTDSPATLRGAVAELLAEPRYRISARRVRAEIESQPAPAEVVSVLEALECED